MTTYDSFTETVWNEPTHCSSCLKRPSLETSSVGTSNLSISSISSYEDGWDDHEGPMWNDPLDANEVAKQAGYKRKREHSLKRTPSARCTPLLAQEEKRQRGQIAIAISLGDPAVPCPPDIEEIDLYMPSVEHKWFDVGAPAQTIVDSDVNYGRAAATTCAQSSATITELPARKATRGCGYSCRLHDVRQAGLVNKPGETSQMVEVNRGAW